MGWTDARVYPATNGRCVTSGIGFKGVVRGLRLVERYSNGASQGEADPTMAP